MIIFKKLFGVTRYLNPASAFWQGVRSNQKPLHNDPGSSDQIDSVSDSVPLQYDSCSQSLSNSQSVGTQPDRHKKRFWLIRWIMVVFDIIKKSTGHKQKSLSLSDIESKQVDINESQLPDSLSDSYSEVVSELDDTDDTVVSFLAYRMTTDHNKDKESWNSLKGEDFDQAFEAWFEHLTESAEESSRAQSRRASLKLVYDAGSASSQTNRNSVPGDQPLRGISSVWDRPSRIEYLDSGPPSSLRGELTQLRLTWADGRTYQGQTLGLKPQGFGVMQWPDGRRYEGHFHRGLAHGQGLLVLPNSERFSCEFASGKPCLKLCTESSHPE